MQPEDSGDDYILRAVTYLSADGYREAVLDYDENGALEAYEEEYWLSGYGIYDLADTLLNCGSQPDCEMVTMSGEHYVKLFGEGFLNAGSAVKGPAYLDAYRLADDDITDLGDSILYPVEIPLEGATWRWLHDVGERTEYYGGGNYAVGLKKSGPGTLALYGVNTFSGPVTIEEGRLLLSGGSIPGALTVAADGSVAGNGSVGGAADIYGKLTPGDESAYGALTFNSGLALNPGSETSLRLGKGGVPGTDSDLVSVPAGTLTLGGDLAVTADSAYSEPFGTEWRLFSADDITGSFSEVAFDGFVTSLILVSPALRADEAGGGVYLSYVQAPDAGEALNSLPITQNQAAAAGALLSLPADSPLLKLVRGQAVRENALSILDSLSGEAHAALQAWTITVPLAAERGILAHAARSGRAQRPPEPPPSAGAADDNFAGRVWAGFGASRGTLRAPGGGGKSTLSGAEGSLGLEFTVNSGYTLGFALYFADKDFRHPSKNFRASLKSLGVSAYVEKSLTLSGSELRLLLGAG
jgi:autotransporter-associated beta strand protein